MSCRDVSAIGIRAWEEKLNSVYRQSYKHMIDQEKYLQIPAE